jgi:hypothetical protein
MSSRVVKSVISSSAEAADAVAEGLEATTGAVEVVVRSFGVEVVTQSSTSMVVVGEEEEEGWGSWWWTWREEEEAWSWGTNHWLYMSMIN